MTVINGKQIAQEVLLDLKRQISENNLSLHIVAVLVGDEPGLKKFVELKDIATKSIGIESKSYFFPDSISEEELKNEVTKISADPDVNGVFVELPLPKHINAQNILNVILVEKDLDALSEKAQKLLYEVEPRINEIQPQILPPVVESTKIVFDKYGIEVKGKKIAVFGQGFLVGKPIAYWLEKNGAEVYRIDINTKNPEQYSSQADIIISGVGKPDLITGDMVKEGVVVIDFGYGQKGGHLVGDVNFDSVALKASLITPVPGGMGPILIAAVLKNLVNFANSST